MPNLHADAVRVLSDWAAPSDAQETVRQEFLNHLATHPEAMWRECRAGHITASTIVFDASRTHVLLTLHTKLQQWLQLGGHCEHSDVSLLQAATREAAEESGIADLVLEPTPIQIDRHAVPCHPEGSFHLDVQYLAIARPGTTITITDESDDLRWFPLNALPDETNSIVRSLVVQGQRQ